MTRLFLRLPLDRIDPPRRHDNDPRRRVLLVAPLVGTIPLRYVVVAGGDTYRAAVKAGRVDVDAEVTLP